MGKSEISIGDNGSALVSKLASNFTELYSASNVSDYIIQTTDNIALKTWWDEKVVNYNTFIIADDFDFNGASLTLPAGVSLFFNGGVWSNGTITGDNSNIIPGGLRQCFETTLTLAGKWNMAYITPQHYGAKSNANTGLTTNDCTASIQKILDTGFSVVIPNGLYYLTDSLIITKPVSVACSKSNIRYSSSVVSTQDHVRLYTDQNKPILTIRSGGFVWSGGILDIRNAAAYNTGVIKFDLNYTYFYIDIKTAIHGNGTSIRDVAGYTPYGTYFACDEATSTHEIHDINLDVDCYYLAIGNYLAPRAPGFDSLVSIGKFIINTWGCKQAQVLEEDMGSGVFDIDGWHESPGNLTYAESLNPVIYNKCSYVTIEGRFYDYGMSLPPDYDNEKFIVTEGYSCVISGHSLEIYGSNKRKYINKSDPRPLSTINQSLTLLDGKSRLSLINNDWAFLLNTTDEITINKYDGTGVDFTTEMNPLTTCPASDVIIYVQNYFFNYRFKNSITYLSQSDVDFIEIVIPLNIGIDFLSLLIYTITFTEIHPLIIQTIIRDNNDVDHSDYIVVTDYAVSGSPIFVPFPDNQLYNIGFDNGGIKRVIIRFIGSSDSGVYTINEIYANYRNLIQRAYIDVGGDQVIYGNLAVKDGVKETDLPVYADNTAALTGGLVAGDPYRTATGVRMVVYD